VVRPYSQGQLSALCASRKGNSYPVKQKCGEESSPSQSRSFLSLQIIQDLLLLAEERQELQDTGGQGIRRKFGGDETLYTCGNGSIDELLLFSECGCAHDRDDCILALECFDQVGLGVICLADSEALREGSIGGGAGQSRDLELWGVDEGIRNKLPDRAAGL